MQQVVDFQLTTSDRSISQYTSPPIKCALAYFETLFADEQQILIDSPTLNQLFDPVTGKSYSFMHIRILHDFEVNTQEINAKQTAVYPNPFREVFYVSEIPLGTAYKIYDTHGRIVQKDLLESQEVSLKQKGVFIIQFNMEDGGYFNKMIISK